MEEDKEAPIIRKVINEKFDEYIQERRKELTLIDERILEVRKLLQLVRYGAVKEYYAQTQPKQSQNKGLSIHPATKALLMGKRPRSSSSVGATSVVKQAKTDNNLLLCVKEQAQNVDGAKPKQSNVKSKSENLPIKQNELEQSKIQPAEEKALPGYVPPLPKENPFKVLAPRAAQHKIKRRIVVGNVSKWIPEEGRDGASTHKWMVYVRGEEGNPHLPEVLKIVFTLHESYSPHHVVEVVDQPFQLTRRGWGEFPIKVEIYFACLENKPIQLVHNLKLDKTHSGHQTLGAETIVDVFLFKSKTPDYKSDTNMSKYSV